MKLYHFTNAEHGLAALRDQRIKIALINELNDPFELIPMNLTDKVERRNFKAFKRLVAKSYGLVCFSTSRRNPVMWSHYADKHQGVALEFQVSDENAFIVNYEPDRISFDFEHVIENQSFSEADLNQLFSTKYKDWSYESEVRLLAPLSNADFDNEMYFERFNNEMELTGIVLGAECEISDEQIASSLEQGRAINRKVSRLAFGSFAMVNQKQRPDRTIKGTAVAY
jgi:hypothetical protein